MKNFAKETQIVHGAPIRHVTSRDLAPPIHLTSTFTFEDSNQGSGVFDGSHEGYVYTRISNPTVDLLQEKIAVLEEGEAAIATASGMAAVAAAGMALAKPGDNLVSCTTLYGGVFALFDKHFKDLNIQARFISPRNGASRDRLERLIDEKTRFLYMETPANPTLDVIDIALWASAARKAGIPLIVDNTFASPFLQRPLALGADIVVHSATKYLGGHGDIIGGLIVGSREMMGLIQEEHTKNFGPIMSPFNAWLFLRGVKTLALRMERHGENALCIAKWLESHPEVTRVYYPGLPSSPGHAIAKKQMKNFGGMIAFEVKGGVAAGRALMDNLRLCVIAVSLGDCETLLQHPASMTHATYSKEDRKKAGITDGLIRLSVGIEHVDDIIADLENALASVPMR